MLIIRNNIFYFIRNFVKLFRKTSVDRSAAESSAHLSSKTYESEAYTRSGEWQLVHCPVLVTNNSNSQSQDPVYEDIVFYFIIRNIYISL